MGKPITQYCAKCGKRKPIRGFNVRLGICSDCKKLLAAAKAVKPPKSKLKPKPKPDQGPKTSTCPRCLQRVNVKHYSLEAHNNLSRTPCAGSGHALPQRSKDALDYRIRGSFEGGKR